MAATMIVRENPAKFELLSVLAKAFLLAQDQTLLWTDFIDQSKLCVKDISVLGETLRSCSTADIKRTRLAQTHPGIRQILLLKLEKEIENEREKLGLITDNLKRIVHKIVSENRKVFIAFKNCKSVLSEDELYEKTEILPSLIDMIQFMENINNTFQKSFSELNFVTQTTDFNELTDAKLFSTTWQDDSYKIVVADALAFVQFFLLEMS